MDVLIIGIIGTWSALGASLSRLLQTPERMWIANAVMGGALMVFAGDILLGQVFWGQCPLLYYRKPISSNAAILLAHWSARTAKTNYYWLHANPK